MAAAAKATATFICATCQLTMERSQEWTTTLSRGTLILDMRDCGTRIIGYGEAPNLRLSIDQLSPCPGDLRPNGGPHDQKELTYQDAL